MSNISLPLGSQGSGRARYAAAMELYQAGKISPQALEIYRISSALDGQDPAPILAKIGAPAMAEPASDEGLIHRLIDEADRYLASLAGPGVAEVRAGLNRWRSGPVTPKPRVNAVVAAHLSDALAALSQTHLALAQSIALAAPHLPWTPYDGYPVAAIGADFAKGNAFASLMGEDATIPATNFDFGLFLIAPHLSYRDHHHPAPELYVPLTGPHGWRFGPQSPLIVKPAHVPVWNAPHRPHMTKVGPLPFLCLFGWTADVNALAKVIPAPDWAALEALRLG
ncbi:MAG: dimethylsulfonioproprionate lyase family protein [Cypionkella sp.]